jgi:hypothetical protein
VVERGSDRTMTNPEGGAKRLLRALMSKATGGFDLALVSPAEAAVIRR